ncbi:MAG: hypothetical protein ABR498_03830 [Candidatus Dormibacteria bacterium]
MGTPDPEPSEVSREDVLDMSQGAPGEAADTAEDLARNTRTRDGDRKTEAEAEADRDDTVAESFPASDPPASY